MRTGHAIVELVELVERKKKLLYLMNAMSFWERLKSAIYCWTLTVVSMFS